MGRVRYIAWLSTLRDVGWKQVRPGATCAITMGNKTISFCVKNGRSSIKVLQTKQHEPGKYKAVAQRKTNLRPPKAKVVSGKQMRHVCFVRVKEATEFRGKGGGA